MSQEYLLYSNVSALSGQVPSSCWSCIQNLECVRTSSSETCHRRPHPQCGIDLSIQNTAVNGVTDSQPLWRIWVRGIHGLAQVFHLKTVGLGVLLNAWIWLSYLQYCLPWTSQQLQHLQIPTAMVPNCNHSSAIVPNDWKIWNHQNGVHFQGKKPWLSKMHHFFLPCSIEAVSNNLCVSVRSGKQQLLPVAFESCSANCIV